MSDHVHFCPEDRANLLNHEINDKGQITMSPRGIDTSTKWITAESALNLEDVR